MKAKSCHHLHLPPIENKRDAACQSAPLNAAVRPARGLGSSATLIYALRPSDRVIPKPGRKSSSTLAREQQDFCDSGGNVGARTGTPRAGTSGNGGLYGGAGASSNASGAGATNGGAGAQAVIWIAYTPSGTGTSPPHNSMMMGL
jgi:hypothetical protein